MGVRMECKSCIVCKIISALVIIGALNWGLVGAFNFNLVSMLLGMGLLARIVYILVGVAGVMELLKCFKMCPCQKKPAA